MKRFINFLLEKLLAEMSVDDAYQILSIDPNKDYDLKKAYKDAAKTYHPDRQGGNNAMMVKVNAAKEVLSRIGTSPAQTKIDKQRTKEANIKKGERIAYILRQALNTTKYQEYFNQYAKGLIHDFDEKVRAQDWFNGWVTHTHKFHNVDNTTVFFLEIHVSLSDVNFTKSLGSGEDGISFRYMVDRYLYHNKRKQKMKQANWEFKGNTLEISNPSKMFPHKTLKAVFTGQKQRKFAKRDFAEALTRELKARLEYSGGDTWARIPVDKDHHVAMFRMTMMRQGSWSANGIYKNNGGRVDMLKGKTIVETENGLNFLMDVIKGMRKKSGVKSMVKYYNKEMEKYNYT